MKNGDEIKKVYYSITEVSKLLDTAPYTIRGWETYFGNPKPRRKNNNVRIYTIEDIEILNLIKKLLKTDHYSMLGAKMQLEKIKEEKGRNYLGTFPPPNSKSSLTRESILKNR